MFPTVLREEDAKWNWLAKDINAGEIITMNKVFIPILPKSRALSSEVKTGDYRAEALNLSLASKRVP